MKTFIEITIVAYGIFFIGCVPIVAQAMFDYCNGKINKQGLKKALFGEPTFFLAVICVMIYFIILLLWYIGSCIGI